MEIKHAYEGLAENSMRAGKNDLPGQGESAAQRGELEVTLAHTLSELGTITTQIRKCYAHAAGLHPTDLKALSLIYQAQNANTPLSIAALGKALDLSKGAATYAVDRLEAAGHVERQNDPSDRRRQILTHGKRGAELAHQFFGQIGQVQSQATAGYTNQQLRDCLELLEKLNQAYASLAHQTTAKPAQET